MSVQQNDHVSSLAAVEARKRRKRVLSAMIVAISLLMAVIMSRARLTSLFLASGSGPFVLVTQPIDFEHDPARADLDRGMRGWGGIATTPNRLYVERFGALIIYGISVQGNAEPIGRLALRDHSVSLVAAEDNIVVLVAGSLSELADIVYGSDVLVYDTTNPSQPQLLSDLSADSDISAFAYSNRKLILASKENGVDQLYAYSLDNWSSPQPIGSPLPIGQAVIADMTLVDENLFLSTMGNTDVPGTNRPNGQVTYYQLANESIAEVATVSMPAAAYDLRVIGSYLIATSNQVDVISFAANVGDLPVKATLELPVGSYAVGSIDTDFFLYDPHLSEASLDTNLVRVDLSDPLAPRLANESTIGGIVPMAVGVDTLDVTSSKAYVVEDTGVHAYPLSTLLTATGLSTPPIARQLVVGVAVSGTAAYVVDAFYGLRVIDLSNPVSPSLQLASYQFDSSSMLGQDDGATFAVTGTTLLVATGSGALYVFDVSQPLEPQFVSRVPDSGDDGLQELEHPKEMVLRGNYVHVVASGGISTFDFSDRSHLQKIATIEAPGSELAAHDVGGASALGDLILLSSSGGSERLLATWDTSSISAPVQVDLIDVSPFWPERVAASSNTGYVLDVSGSLLTISVSGSGTITQTASIQGADPTYQPVGLGLSSHYAIALSHSGLLEVYDVANPVAPVLTGSIQVGLQAFGMSIVGDLVIVALGTELAVVDLQDPTAPAKVASLQFHG